MTKAEVKNNVKQLNRSQCVELLTEHELPIGKMDSINELQRKVFVAYQNKLINPEKIPVNGSRNN